MTPPSAFFEPDDPWTGRVNAGAADYLEAATVRLFDLEQREAARFVLPVVVRHLDVIAAALGRANSEQERRRLTLLHGEAAVLAGWLVFDQEDAQGAHRYWDMALAAAQQAESEPLLACAQTHLSYAAAERGDPAAALQLARAALSPVADDKRARAWIAARAAQTAADLGDQATAFTNLDLAIEAGHDLGPVTAEGGTSRWARFVDSAYIWGMVASTFSRMKITSDAYVAAIWARDALRGDQTKARALTLAEIAYALAAVWQFDEAAWFATEAMELAEKLEAIQARQRLRAAMLLLPEPFSRRSS